MSEQTTHIPYNAEHAEAFQAEINTQRAEIKAGIRPEEQERMTAIEQAAALLEAAKVPFVLFGNAHSSQETGMTGYIRFNRLEYLPDSATFDEKIDVFRREKLYVLSPYLVQWATGTHGVARVVAYNADFKPLFGYDLTEIIPKLLVVPADEIGTP